MVEIDRLGEAPSSPSKGVLTIEVKSPVVIAGKATTVSLIIRNPFSEPVKILRVEAPSASPLLPARSINDVLSESSKKGVWKSITAAFSTEFNAGLHKEALIGEFPERKGRRIEVIQGKDSELTLNQPFSHNDDVRILMGSDSKVTYNVPREDKNYEDDPIEIGPFQENISKIDIKTAKWLLVKPITLDLHALILYKIGEVDRSQIVPISISLQPPARSIVFGGCSGAGMGYLARLFNSTEGFSNQNAASFFFTLFGILIMAFILSIVLSRQESSKGFITLEDFYGAFVVGVALGYTGTDFFDNIMSNGGGATLETTTQSPGVTKPK